MQQKCVYADSSLGSQPSKGGIYIYGGGGGGRLLCKMTDVLLLFFFLFLITWPPVYTVTIDPFKVSWLFCVKDTCEDGERTEVLV